MLGRYPHEVEAPRGEMHDEWLIGHFSENAEGERCFMVRSVFMGTRRSAENMRKAHEECHTLHSLKRAQRIYNELQQGLAQ